MFLRDSCERRLTAGSKYSAIVVVTLTGLPRCHQFITSLHCCPCVALLQVFLLLRVCHCTIEATRQLYCVKIRLQATGLGARLGLVHEGKVSQIYGWMFNQQVLKGRPVSASVRILTGVETRWRSDNPTVAHQFT